MPNLHSTKILGDLRVTGLTNLSQLGAVTLTGQLTSTVATGTAPLVVASTTRVDNLNVATAGLADSATILQTARLINGISFNGSANIDIRDLRGNNYVSGGSEKPNNAIFGSGKFRYQMLSSSNLGSGTVDSWNDVLWVSSYTGTDVKGSNALIFSKQQDWIGFARQAFDSASWGTVRTIYHTGNTVAIANGGTGATTKAAGFNALSPMTTLGDIIYGGTSGAGTRLAGNTVAAKRFLTQTGNGTISAAPSWETIAAADVPTLNQNTSGSAGSVANAVTFNDGGSGSASGITYDGSAARTISYNTIGAVPTTSLGAASGVATLDAFGTLTPTQIPYWLASGFKPLGAIDTTNTSTNTLSKIISSFGSYFSYALDERQMTGWYFIVTVAGTLTQGAAVSGASTWSGVWGSASYDDGLAPSGSGDAKSLSLEIGDWLVITSAIKTAPSSVQLSFDVISNTHGVATTSAPGITTLSSSTALTTTGNNVVTDGVLSGMLSNLNWDNTNSRLGIGTTTPAVSLDVAGQVAISTETYPSLSVKTTSTQTNLQASSGVFSTSTSGNMADGFGSGIQFAIEDDANVRNSIGFIGAVRSGADNSGRLNFFTNNAGTSTEKMTILPNGNVGIGINPEAKLDVNGGLFVEREAGITFSGPVVGDRVRSSIKSSSSDNTITYHAFGNHRWTQGSSNTELVRITSTGRVGIGTASPAEQLDVSGSIALSGRILSRPGNSVPLFDFTGLNASGLVSNNVRFGSAQGLAIPGATDQYELGLIIETSADPRNFFLKAITGAGRINLVTDYITLSSNANIGGNILLTGASSVSTTTGNLTLATAAGNGNIILTPNGTGRVGIGTTNPGTVLDLASPSGFLFRVNNTTTTTGLSLNAWTNSVNIDPISANTTFRFGRDTALAGTTFESGNVGIGTTAPSSKLHVMGKIDLHESGSGGGQNRFTGLEAVTTSGGRAQLVMSSAYSDLVIASSQANNSHGSTLTFASYNPSNAADYRKFVINQGNWGTRSGFLELGYASNNPNPHTAISSANTIITIDGVNKRVGIGTTSPGSVLHVKNATPEIKLEAGVTPDSGTMRYNTTTKSIEFIFA